MSDWSVEALFSDPRFMAHLRRLLRSQARRRFPSMHALVDDLVGAAEQGLWQYAQEHPDLFRGLDPSSPPPWTGPAWDLLARLARTFLTRRAIDLPRQAAGRWARNHLEISRSATDRDGVLPEHPGRTPSPARLQLLRQMLAVCLDELSRASESEREALWDAMDRGGSLAPMSDAERKRASRLRKRLGLAIRNRLGESVAALLAADLQDQE